MLNQNKTRFSWPLIIVLSILPIYVSIFSTIHVITFFELTNPKWMAIGISIAFEVGALAALASLVIIEKVNKNAVWFIFFSLTLYQMFGNTYHAFDRLSHNMHENPLWINNFIELFGLQESELPLTKRILAIISGAYLPVISLVFLHILISYILVSLGMKEPSNKFIKTLTQLNKQSEDVTEKKIEPIIEEPKVEDNFLRRGVDSSHPIDDKDVVSFRTLRKPEPIVEEIKPLENSEDYAEELQALEDHQENFKKYVEEKKKHVEEMREPNLDLLDMFYKMGSINAGEELPTYSEFRKMVDASKYTDKDIKMFLSMCNYLDVCRVSGTKKIATKSYEDARKTLDDYLSWPT